MDTNPRLEDKLNWLRAGHKPTEAQTRFLLGKLKSPWLYAIDDEDKKIIETSIRDSRITKSMAQMLLENLVVLTLPVQEGNEKEQTQFNDAKKEMSMLIDKLKNQGI